MGPRSLKVSPLTSVASSDVGRPPQALSAMGLSLSPRPTRCTLTKLASLAGALSGPGSPLETETRSFSFPHHRRLGWCQEDGGRRQKFSMKQQVDGPPIGIGQKSPARLIGPFRPKGWGGPKVRPAVLLVALMARDQALNLWAIFNPFGWPRLPHPPDGGA